MSWIYAPSTAGSAPTGLFFKRWSAAHMADDINTAGVVTQASAIALAKNFPVVVVTVRGVAPYEQYLGDMHTAAPNTVVIPYENLAFASGGATQYAHSYYSYDAIGANCWSGGANAGNAFMDLSTTGWQAIPGQLGVGDMSVAAFDGIYYDLCTLSPVANAPGFFNPATTAINSATGRPWNINDLGGPDDYVSAVVTTLNTTRTALNTMAPRSPLTGVVLAGNILGNGGKWFKTDGTSPKPIAQTVDYSHCEDFLRSAATGINGYPSESSWINSVEMLRDIGALGLRALTQTKMWNAGGTAAQNDAWHTFAAATFLMGTDGTSYFTFSTLRTTAEATRDSPYDRVDVGTPTSSYALVAGAAHTYERDFTNGKCLVNMDSVSHTVTLGATYLDAIGTVYAGSINLVPNQGVILHL